MIPYHKPPAYFDTGIDRSPFELLDIFCLGDNMLPCRLFDISFGLTARKMGQMFCGTTVTILESTKIQIMSNHS